MNLVSGMSHSNRPQNDSTRPINENNNAMICDESWVWTCATGSSGGLGSIDGRNMFRHAEASHCASLPLIADLLSRAYGTQSARKTLNSPGVLAWRSDTQ